MLMNKFEGFFIPGTALDVCDLCLKKAQINKQDGKAVKTMLGKLEGVLIHRENNLCFCYDCLKQEIDAIEAIKTEE